MTTKLNISVSHSGQILAGAISTIVTILNLTGIVCHLGGLFSVVFPKNKTVKYSHVTHFIRFYWSYNAKVVEIGQGASSAKIKPNPGRVIIVLRILCN